MCAITIRNATSEDAEMLLGIYAPYVERTAISFEEIPPSADEFRSRIASTIEHYPWLVAERGGETVGYAYMGPFKERAAYAHSAEVSVYVREDVRGQGIARRLYAELERGAKERGILNLYACVAYVEENEEHLTRASYAFHLRMGYRLVGIFRKCGRKFGNFYDMAYMEKLIHEPMPEVADGKLSEGNECQ